MESRVSVSVPPMIISLFSLIFLLYLWIHFTYIFLYHVLLFFPSLHSFMNLKSLGGWWSAFHKLGLLPICIITSRFYVSISSFRSCKVLIKRDVWAEAQCVHKASATQYSFLHLSLAWKVLWYSFVYHMFNEEYLRLCWWFDVSDKSCALIEMALITFYLKPLKIKESTFWKLFEIIKVCQIYFSFSHNKTDFWKKLLS